MDRAAWAVGNLMGGIVAWGCFSMLVGYGTGPARNLAGWKPRMLGLLGALALRASWIIADIFVYAASLINSHPSAELSVIVADVSAIVAAMMAMNYVRFRWTRTVPSPNERASSHVALPVNNPG
jgi:hypothetical protein